MRPGRAGVTDRSCRASADFLVFVMRAAAGEGVAVADGVGGSRHPAVVAGDGVFVRERSNAVFATGDGGGSDRRDGFPGLEGGACAVGVLGVPGDGAGFVDLCP